MSYYINKYKTKVYIEENINFDYEYEYDREVINDLWYLVSKNKEIKYLIHRIDGPAVETYFSTALWYYHGEKIHCKDNEEFLKIISMKAFL